MPSQIWSLLLFELDQEPQPVSHEWALLHVHFLLLQISAGLFEQFDTCKCSECLYNRVSKWQHWPAQPKSHCTPEPREEVHTLDNIILLRVRKKFYYNRPFIFQFPSPLQTGQSYWTEPSRHLCQDLQLHKPSSPGSWRTCPAPSCMSPSHMGLCKLWNLQYSLTWYYHH